MSQITHQDRDERAIAYQKPQPTGMVPDLLVPGAINIPQQVDGDDPG